MSFKGLRPAKPYESRFRNCFVFSTGSSDFRPCRSRANQARRGRCSRVVLKMAQLRVNASSFPALSKVTTALPRRAADLCASRFRGWRANGWIHRPPTEANASRQPSSGWTTSTCAPPARRLSTASSIRRGTAFQAFVTLSTLPSGSLNQATQTPPPGRVRMPSSF